jgi:hypothetical protein
MSDQQVKYTITADATQANTELAKVDKAAVSLVGNEQKLATETNKATAALKEQGKVATTTATSTETLRQRIGKSAENLSKQAAAVSLVSSSMEGMGGQVGKVVAGAGQMAAAYGAGGPFALALVGGLAAVDALSSHLATLNREQDELIAKTYGPVEAAAGQMQKVERDLAALRRDAAGPETVKQAAARVQTEIDAVNAQVDEVIKARNAMKVSGTQEYFEERDRYEKQRRILQKTVELLQQKQNLEQGKAATANLPAKKIGPTVVKPEAFDAVQSELDLEEKAVNWLTKMRDEAITHRLKNEADAREEKARMDKEATDEEKRQAAERVKIAEDEANKKQSIADSQAAFVTNQLMKTSSVIAQSAAAAAKGQEDAGAILLQGLAQQAGDLITLKGAESAATGLAQLFTGNPAGAVPLAGGLALIAAGQAIAVGGAEVAASMVSSAAKTPSPDKSASRDRGASPGRGGSGSGGGPLVVNVAYGVGGPLPEDTAREISKAVNTGRRRGGR